MDENFEVLWNAFPGLALAMHKTVSQLVRKAAFDIETDAKTRVPVDTGFLKNSIYVVTHDRSSYDGGGEDAAHQLLPEIERPPDDLTAYVAVGAEYAIYVEMGTSTNFAQPFLTPAADFVRPEFEEAMRRLEDAMLPFIPGLLGGGPHGE